MSSAVFEYMANELTIFITLIDGIFHSARVIAKPIKRCVICTLDMHTKKIGTFFSK